MSTGPCEAVRIARDCQLKTLVVARPLVLKGVVVVVVYLTLTDPLRIQPWSQDGTKPNQTGNRS